MRLSADKLRSFSVAGLLLIATATLAAYPGTARVLERVDLLIYDLLLPLQAPPVSDEITVVAIDDRSLETLGRWPWSREVHAQLIERLTAMHARVIGVDVLFLERQTDTPDADRRLKDALESARVVLPVAPTRASGSDTMAELLPLPELATAASALGHVDVELDVDGSCRSVYLYAGLGDARWPSLPLAMLAVAGVASLPRAAAGPAPVDTGKWRRDVHRRIPFTRAGASPAEVSVADVLSGEAAPSTIDGKYVLVGLTATGLGDFLSTPGAPSHERMPGVRLNAQVLNGLVQERMITFLGSGPSVLASLGLLLPVAVLLLVLPLRANLLVAGLGVGATLALAGTLLATQRLWFAPTATLLAVLLLVCGWTVWQYRRLEALRDRLLVRLDELARRHQATGLPNRDMLKDRLRNMAEDESEAGVAALIVMHINWPGSATVMLDRPISDEVLQTIRDRLLSIGRDGDFIAHLSGDDFALLARGYATQEEARQAANRFLEQIQEPLKCGGEPLLLVPQIGVSFWPQDNQDPRQLLSNAYTAMFTARIDDSEPLSLYSASVSEELHKRSRLEQAMVHALERGEFELHYQPQVGTADGRIRGVEALLRWNNPVLGWISPAAFIPVAEHVGLIQSIGSWVIQESCSQLRTWNAEGHAQLRLAINTSPLQFTAQRIENDFRALLERTDINPGLVELEITESSLMRDVDEAIRAMNALKAMGLDLAIDDFGTGYSSLSSLRDFPLDRLKIDMTFVREIGKRADAEEITLTIIAIARQLGLNVIAEGVETRAQAAFLHKHGCDELQGFLLARPMPAAEVTDVLAKGALGLRRY